MRTMWLYYKSNLRIIGIPERKDEEGNKEPTPTDNLWELPKPKEITGLQNGGSLQDTWLYHFKETFSKTHVTKMIKN